MLRGAAVRLLVLSSVLMVGGCDLRSSVRCAFTDIRADLLSSDASTRGLAAECAFNQSPDQIAPLVPLLLPHVGDDTVYRSFYSGGGLIGFGEAGQRTLSVALVASRAVQKAKPVEANIEPIVSTLTTAAKAMRSPSTVGTYGDPSTTAVAMLELLKHDFHRAGLGARIAVAIQRELPVLRGTQFAQDPDTLRALLALASGVAPSPDAGWLVSEPQPRRLPGPHGLTWGVAAARQPGGFSASCHAGPKAPMDSLHNGSCNPYAGDTACTAHLPLLCLSPETRELALTPSVAGTELVSRLAADAKCQAALGPRWRMAEHHDGGSGWELHGRGPLPDAPTRFWVAIDNQPANCWSR